MPELGGGLGGVTQAQLEAELGKYVSTQAPQSVADGGRLARVNIGAARADVGASNLLTITSYIEPFTPGVDYTQPSLVVPYNQRGARLVLQNVGANPAQLWKGTSTAYWFFSTPGADANYNINLPAGDEFVMSGDPFMLWAISSLGTTLKGMLTIGPDA